MADSDLIPVSRLFRFACEEEVTRMPVTRTGHHCASCRKTVVDMGRLTPAEAVDTVRTAPPSTCVSYGVAEDGNLLFRAGRGTVAVALSVFLAACQSGVPIDPLPSAGPEPAAEPAQPEPAAVVVATPTSNLPPPEPTIGPAWPSATQTTVQPAAPPRTQPKPPRPPPTPIRHTAGKPVQHYAGGLAVVGEDMR